jgi:hypothetical protein
MGKAREGEENKREKRISAEIVWAAVPPDDRREEIKSHKRKGKERLLDLNTVVTMVVLGALLNEPAGRRS